jgi:hypothetical protein
MTETPPAFSEVVGGEVRLAVERVVRTRHQRERDRVDVDEGQGLRGRGEAQVADVVTGVQKQRRVEASGGHVVQEPVSAAFGADLDLDVGTSLGQPGQHLRDIGRRDRLQRAQPHERAFAAHFAPCLLGLGQQTSGPLQHPLARRREPHPLRAADEEGHLQRPLQGPDLF